MSLMSKLKGAAPLHGRVDGCVEHEVGEGEGRGEGTHQVPQQRGGGGRQHRREGIGVQRAHLATHQHAVLRRGGS